MDSIRFKTFELLDELGINKEDVNRLSQDQYLKLARAIVYDIGANLPSKTTLAGTNSRSRLIFKVFTLRDVIAHRVSELAAISIELFDRDLIIPAFIMSRAVLETVCLLYSLYKHVEIYQKDHNVENLDTFLTKALAGSRNQATPHQAINILTSIDKADKEFDGLKRMYEALCEFIHPNCCGVLGAYGKVDNENQCVNYGKAFRSNKIGQGFAPFVMALFIFSDYYNGLSEQLSDINKHDLKTNV